MERTTLILVQSLPGISRWFEVEKREVVSMRLTAICIVLVYFLIYMLFEKYCKINYPDLTSFKSFQASYNKIIYKVVNNLSCPVPLTL